LLATELGKHFSCNLLSRALRERIHAVRIKMQKTKEDESFCDHSSNDVNHQKLST